MTIPFVGAHDAVPPPPHPRLPTVSSGVCRCGAVYDYGNVAVPAEYLGMCGRCAFVRLQRQRPATHWRYAAESHDFGPSS